MRYSKLLTSALLIGGLTLTGQAAKSQNGYWNSRATYHDRQDLRHDRRDLRNDRFREERLRDERANDRYRLHRDFAEGNRWKAGRDYRDLTHDNRALRNNERDMRHDARDIRNDRRDLHNDYRRSWGAR